MKSDNSKLNKALRDALQNHPEPLKNDQWDRIHAALGEKKPRRIIPWLFVGVLILFTAIGGFILGYLSGGDGSSSPKSPALASEQSNERKNRNHEDSIFSQSNHDQTNQSDIQNNIPPAKGGHNQDRKLPQSSEQSSMAYHKLPEPKSGSRGPSLKVIPGQGNSSSDVSKSGANPSDKLPIPETDLTATDPQLKKSGQKEADSIKLSITDNDPAKGKDPLLDLALNTDKFKDIDKAQDSSGSTKNKKDKKGGNKGKDHKDKFDPFNNKLTLSLRFGPSDFKSGIGDFSNPNAVHKDTRNLFENTVSKRNSTNLNFGVQMRVIKGLQLGFNTGIQYRSINEERTYDYILTETPFRDTDGNIQFYIPIPPPQQKIRFNSTERISYKFVSIPFHFRYDFKLSAQSALNTGLGFNLNWVTGLKGRMVNVNQVAYESTSDLVKKRFYSGWSASLGYSHALYKRLWLGAEIGIQRNSMKYDLTYSTFKTAFSFTNYNICLYYKL